MPRSFKYTLYGATLLATLAGAPMHLANAEATIGRAEPARQIEFDVFLPLRDTAGLDTLLAQLHDPASPLFHHWLTPAQFGRRFGPEPASIARLATSLRNRGFAVTQETRSLHVAGSAALAEATFATHMMVAPADAGHSHIVTDSELKLPAEFTAAGATIPSFSPQVAHTFSHRIGPLQPAGVDARTSATGPYWFDDLKQAYSYPSVQATVSVNGNTVKLDGTGATIGVLMASDVLDSDVKAMFDHESWSTVSGTADPVLYKRVAISGGGGLKSQAFDEASLDVQQALGGAPGAHVILYNIPSLSNGHILEGYKTIVEQNETDAVSSSFGGCELAYFPKYNNGKDYRGVLRTLHEVFLQGNAQGISFLASSDDNAGLVCPSLSYLSTGKGTFVKGVASPADDPNVTGVGGTNLVTNVTQGSLDSSYASENAWSDPLVPYDPYNQGGSLSGGVWGAGGGYSQMWKLPDYQGGFPVGSTKWRAIPDVGMQVGGCPRIAVLDAAGTCNGGAAALDGKGNTDRSAVWVAVNVGTPKGGFGGFIGTSVASPEFLSAVALLIETHGTRYGNINEYIYSLAKGQASGGPVFYHTGIPGYNGVKNTLLGPSYSLSTGVGTPVVNSMLFETSLPAAGLPQTASNP